jgi:membrane protease YdiL (CAAX protease family)
MMARRRVRKDTTYKVKDETFGKQVGLGRWPKLRDLWYFLGSIPVYYVILVVVGTVAMFVLGGDVVNQTQELGYQKTGNTPGEIAIIFAALVVIPPICEEIMMRGFLFGKLRKFLSFWPTAIIVSLVFAVAHWQVNVSIDTFVLSLVLCYVREKTGGLWATIGLHMVKNGVAFAVLFL